MPTSGAIARRANKARREREEARENNPIRPVAEPSTEPKYTDEMAKEFHQDSRKVEVAKRQITRDEIEKGSELYRFLRAVIKGGYEDAA